MLTEVKRIQHDQSELCTFRNISQSGIYCKRAIDKDTFRILKGRSEIVEFVIAIHNWLHWQTQSVCKHILLPIQGTVSNNHSWAVLCYDNWIVLELVILRTNQLKSLQLQLITANVTLIDFSGSTLSITISLNQSIILFDPDTYTHR